MTNTSAITFVLWLSALFISITVHEFMHAWTADYLGDPTPRAAGRVSLNPIAHIDPIGTILVPFVLILIGGPVFGWAKPVPINPLNFKNHRLGELLTSIAGPLANLTMLLIFAAIYRFLPTAQKGSVFASFILFIIVINAILMLFNLIPIPPLDGSKVLYAILPDSTALRQFEAYGIFLLIPLIIFFGPVVIGPAINFVLRILGISANLF